MIFLIYILVKIWAMNIFKNMDIKEYIAKQNYAYAMNELTKKFWTDFDHHRDRMFSVFSKIEKISWIAVDYDLYTKIVNPPINNFSQLECSRYCHQSYDKCYPSSYDCHECFKYWCGCCEKGSNSMYFRCNGKICMDFLNSIPELVKNNGRRIHVFERKKEWDFLERKKILRDKEIYGY